MRTILKIFCVALIIFSKKEATGQEFIPKYEAGVNLGIFIYQGDLTPQRIGSLKTPTIAFSIYGSRIVSASFSFRTNLALGKLKGDESKYANPDYRRQRNFRFKTPVAELSELIVWNVLRKNYDGAKSGFAPYLMAGGGLTYLNIKRDWSRLNENYFLTDTAFFVGLNVDINHRLPRLIGVIPVGGGIRYAINQKLAVSGEVLYRFTFTDYIDGFSQSVNPDRNDQYYSITVGLIYRLGLKNRLNCPTVPK